MSPPTPFLQTTLMMLVFFGIVLVFAALLAGFMTLRHAWGVLVWMLPSLFAVGLAYWALHQTEALRDDPRGAARLNSTALAADFAFLTAWAFHTNGRARRGLLTLGALGWILMVVTGGMAVIESANLLLWNAAEPVTWGVIWLETLFVLQLAVLVLAYAHQHTVAAYRLQPGSTAHHPNRPPHPYPDVGYYRPRVAPGQPDPRRNAHPGSHRRPITHAPARANPHARGRAGLTHPPSQPERTGH
jgi:hypothetical protein